jgi:CheY-like chemotaxis protein
MGELVRLAVVDDDPHLRLIVELAFSEAPGMRVRTYGSGPEAIGGIVSGEPPQLVLMDVLMPGMDGVETLRRLRAAEPTAKLPVVFMTAKAQKRDVEIYIAEGAASVIAKPFNPFMLPSHVLDIWRALEQREAVA